MKKLYAHFALFGLLAGLVGASYSMPAAAAVSDEYSAYAGSVSPSNVAEDTFVYEVFYMDEDYLYWYIYVYEIEQVQAKSEMLTAAATDKIFDQ